MSEVENKRVPRALIAKDIYPMMAIIGKIGLRNVMRCMDTMEVHEAMQAGEKTEDEVKAAIGNLFFYGVIDVILERMEKCEGVIAKLLARLYDMKEAEVAELDPNEYLDMLIDVMMSDNFADFFKRAYESAKRVM